MTFATYSFENRLTKKLRTWNMSLDSFSSLVALAGIAGASRSRIASALNGRAFSVEVALSLESLVADIDALMAAAAPLKLDVSTPVEFFAVMTAFRDGTLEIKIAKQ
jgi:hypothetical protein